jgi:hypothetical protein
MPKPPPDTSNPPIILWRTGYQYSSTPPIIRVLAVKVTDKTALLPNDPTWRRGAPQRVMLRSQHEQYHLTWAEAYAFVRDRATRRLNDAERALAQAVAHHKEVLALTPPEEGV